MNLPQQIEINSRSCCTLLFRGCTDYSVGSGLWHLWFMSFEPLYG
jgi:hypothetical protein